MPRETRPAIPEMHYPHALATFIMKQKPALASRAAQAAGFSASCKHSKRTMHMIRPAHWLLRSSLLFAALFGFTSLSNAAEKAATSIERMKKDLYFLASEE